MKHGTAAGYQHHKCRCAKCRQANAKLSAKWRSRPGSRDKIRNYFYKNTYGISLDERNRLLDEQNGACKICQNVFKTRDGREGPHLDHNHNTGEVRGVLCQQCNRVLGLLKDNPSNLLRAYDYLMNNGKVDI